MSGDPSATDSGGRGTLRIAQDDWARAVAIIARATGDPDLAEDAVQDAVAAALEHWPRDGTPANQLAWIITVARNRALDVLRRRGAQDRAIQSLRSHIPSVTVDEIGAEEDPFPDERLALIFACCHPALSTESQVALTLRLVAGLATDEIARAFVVAESTMGQRLSRAKAKVRDAGIPIQVPDRDRLPERRDAVLAVLYLIFNAGYSDVNRADTAAEAIRLGRMLADLLPADAEVHGLLALMLLQESRRRARTASDGSLIVLKDQDRSLWDRRAIAEGVESLRRAAALESDGPYQLQAAIAACHALSQDHHQTDWRTIVALYGALHRVTGSPIVEVNRAVAIAHSGRPKRALEILDEVAGQLDDYHAFHAARADVALRLGDADTARSAFERAAELAPTAQERDHLRGAAEKMPRS